MNTGMKRVGVPVLLLILAVMVVGLFLPTENRVSRSVVIQSTTEPIHV